LGSDQLRVGASGREQLRVGALLYDAAIVHDEDEVRSADGAQSMRNHDPRARKLRQLLLHGVLAQLHSGGDA